MLEIDCIHTIDLPPSLTTLRSVFGNGISIISLPHTITELDCQASDDGRAEIIPDTGIEFEDYSEFVEDPAAVDAALYVLQSEYEMIGSPKLPKSLTKLTAGDFVLICFRDLVTLISDMSADLEDRDDSDDPTFNMHERFALVLRNNIYWPYFQDTGVRLHTLCLSCMNYYHVTLLKSLPSSITDLKISAIYDPHLHDKRHLKFSPLNTWLPNLRRLCLRYGSFVFLTDSTCAYDPSC